MKQWVEASLSEVLVKLSHPVHGVSLDILFGTVMQWSWYLRNNITKLKQAIIFFTVSMLIIESSRDKFYRKQSKKLWKWNWSEIGSDNNVPWILFLYLFLTWTGQMLSNLVRPGINLTCMLQSPNVEPLPCFKRVGILFHVLRKSRGSWSSFHLGSNLFNKGTEDAGHTR